MNSYEPVWLLFFPLEGRIIVPVSDQKKVFEETEPQKGKRFIFKHFSTASSAWDFRVGKKNKKAVKLYRVYTLTEAEFKKGKLAKLTDDTNIFVKLAKVASQGWSYFGNIGTITSLTI